MATVRKKISELTPLTSASLDTTIVGVDNGTTYKIELDTLADAVTSRVNILDRDRLSSLESVTSSFETKGRSIISSSTQITSLGFVSNSVDISSLNSFTSSQSTLNTAFTNGINARLQTSSFNEFSTSVDSRIIAATNEQSLTHLVNTSSFNQYTASISTASLVDRLNQIESVSGSWITESETGSFLTSLPNGILSGSVSYNDLTNIPVGLVSQSTDLTSLNQFTQSIDSRVDNLENTTGSYLTSLNGAISSSSQLTSSYDTRYVISGSITQTTWDNIASKPSDIVSGSSQLTSSYDTRYTLSGSVSAVPAGTISGSAQITAFGFVSSSTSVPAGTISGSSQLTSSFDGRYVQTGSFNTLTASFNSFTASAQSVTTGSNSFNGTQTITGSLIITTGSFVGSQILANTSSLYLTSGSNMYVQNNGVVEITGSLVVSGSATFRGTNRFETVGGDEGGEIEFGVPQTNTTLSTRVVADIYQNRLRIFDGNTNGVFIDLSKAPTGVAGEITYKASGIVNAGTFVQLDNIKATIPSSGNRALALVTTSGTISGYISAHYQGILGGSSGIAQSISLSTSTNTSIFGWNFGQQGDTSHYILRDDTNNRVYRFVVIIGGSYNNNFISIERLH